MLKKIKKMMSRNTNKVIIATSGTSIIGNYSRFFENNDQGKALINNVLGNNHEENFFKFINSNFENLSMADHSKLISLLTKEDKIKLSAEITTNYSYCKTFDIQKCEVYLITTHSEKANMAGEVSKKVLEELFKEDKREIKISVVKIDNLDASQDTKEDYIEKGVIKYFKEIIKIDKQSKNKETILNFTGGYKSLIPYTAYISGILGLKMIYKFENRQVDKILEYPHIPIDKEILKIWMKKIEDYSQQSKRKAKEYVQANNLHVFYDIEKNELSNFAKLISETINTRSER